jgi:uncharacterized protein
MVAPRPLVTEIGRPYWEALAEGRVSLPHCGACDRLFFHPRAFCPHCGASGPGWRDVPGTGTLYTFTLTQVPVAPDFADQPPLLLAVVELAPDVRLATTLVDVAPEAVRIGMAVAPVFDRETFAGLTLLRFRPG